MIVFFLQIPKSSDGNYWWEYVDPNVTVALLDRKLHRQAFSFSVDFVVKHFFFLATNNESL